MASLPDAEYWTALGILLVPSGACLRYFVWNFFEMPQTLHSRYSDSMTEARTTIHERRFLPALVQIYDQVSARKKLMEAASTTDILMELPIDAQVRVAMAAVSERSSLDDAFNRAIALCPWVAVSWLIVTCACLALFFVRHGVGEPWKTFGTWTAIIAIVGASLLGVATLVLFYRARTRLIRVLGANRL